MKRRWFGVVLTLFSSISILLWVIPATPAYAADSYGCPGGAVGPVLPTANYPCPIAGGAVVNGVYVPAPTASPAAAPTEPCNADGGFTWLICGAITIMVGTVDSIRTNIIVPFLKEPALDKNQAAFKDAYTIWSAFRNVASVFFILVFFLVIIGTAAGFDSYTVKKVLPHLVAGAILVPFSWYLCAFVIDIGNVLGQGIVSLVNSTGIQPEIDLTSNFAQIFLGGVGVGAVFLLVGAVTTIGMGVIISIVIAFLGVFLTLMLRKIFIILAVVLSPVAILAWVLPNTEKWFKSWWQNFFKLVMMYPIIIMLFEAGRIFSATARATHTGAAATGGAGAGDWIVPFFQIAGLILPLFAVPFAFKFAGAGLAAGNNMIGRATGGLDKRFGKNSDSAKVAAQNREIKNIDRARRLGEKAESANGFKKASMLAGQRLANRRAGYATPLNKNARGFMSNPTALLAQEAAYGSAKGKMGILDANALNKQQGIEGETDLERTKAEAILAQNKKLGDRAMRKGIIKSADEQGAAGLGSANREIFQQGIEQSRVTQGKKAGDAEGYNNAARANYKTTPELAAIAAEHAEGSETESRGADDKTLQKGHDLDAKRMLDHNTVNPTRPITQHQAHEMRMASLAAAAATNASMKSDQKEIDVNATNQSEAEANQEEINRFGGTINADQARRNRSAQTIAAGVSQKRISMLNTETDARTYNEVERTGGVKAAKDLMDARRLQQRGSIADEYAKTDAALIGGRDAAGADRVSTNNMVQASTYTGAKAFGTQQGNIAAAHTAMVNEAANEPILGNRIAGSVAANQAAARRSFDAVASTKAKQLIETTGKEQGVIAADEELYQRAVESARTTGAPAPTRQAIRDDIMTKARYDAQGGAAHSTTAEYGRIQGETDEYDDAVKVLTDTGMALGDAQAQISNSRLKNNFVTTRENAAREGRKKSDGTASVAKDLEAAILQEASVVEAAARTSGAALSPADVRARAESNIRARNLSAIGTKAATEASIASRVQIEEATNVQAATDLAGTDFVNADPRLATAIADAEAAELAAGRPSLSKDEARKRALAANPSIVTDARAKAQTRIVDNRGTTAGQAAGTKFTKDINADTGVQDVFNKDVEAYKTANAGVSQADAEIAVRNKRLTDSGTTARDVTQRRTQQEIDTDAGVAEAVETEIQNEIAADANTIGPKLPPDTARDRARAEANVLKDNMTAIGRNAKNSAATDRIQVPTRAAAALETHDAAIDIAAENKVVNQKVDEAKNTKRNSIDIEKIRKERLDKRHADRTAGKLSADEWKEDDETAANRSTDEYVEAETQKAGAAAELAAREDAKLGKLDIPKDRTDVEREVLTAAGRASGEEMIRTEAATQARRSALNEAAQSKNRPQPRERIEVNRKTNIEQAADETAKLTAQKDLPTRSYDTAVNEAFNLREREVIKDRAIQVGKQKFDDLDPDYKKAITDEIGFNPFNEIAIDEVDLATGEKSPVKALQIIARTAIKKRDWGTARAALSHMSESAGAYDVAAELLQIPVKDGGFGGDNWNIVDDTNADSSILKDLWAQSTANASKGNTDQNKPIGVAARDFNAEKLAGTNDKQMKRYLKYYREGEKQLLDDRDRALEVLKTTPDTPENAEIRNRANYAVSEYSGRSDMLLRGIKDMKKTIPEVLSAQAESGKGGFGTETLRAMVNDYKNNRAIYIANPDRAPFDEDLYEQLKDRLENGVPKKKPAKS
jgi:hypothetical protein